MIKQFPLWPKQLQALNTQATEVLYGGAAGPGKSHLLRVAFITWAMKIPGLQLYLFRRHYRDLIQGHVEGPTGFKSMLAEAVDAGTVQIVELEIRFKNGPLGGFEGGSRISLNHCQHEQDVTNYKTIEFHVLGVEEATEFTEFMIRFLRSRIRMPEIMNERIPIELRGLFPRALYVTNPGGIGHGYFKKKFIDPVQQKDTIWIAPDDDGGMVRQFIKARLIDNPSVNPVEYAKKLKGLGSPQYVKALLDGDWNAPVGAFFTEWAEHKHVTPDFTPPTHWFRFRTFDWGTAEPFVCYWWCVSDGESFMDSANKMRWYPKGSIVAYREWYGCNPDKHSEGIRMRNEDIAAGILTRSDGVDYRVPTLTDSLPFQDRGGRTIAQTFAENGVLLTLGDTSRESGWSQLRSRLIGKKVDYFDEEETPMIFFVESCLAARDYVPALQRHPSESKKEDAQEHGEATHACDAIRLACTAWTKVKELPNPEPQTDGAHNLHTFNSALERHKHLKAHRNGTPY